MNDHKQLHAYVLAAIDEIKQRFAAADVGEFRMDIECYGRTMGSSQPVVVYRLSVNTYDSTSPKGASLAPVIAECLRRRRWERDNDPLSLPAPELPAPELEI